MPPPPQTPQTPSTPARKRLDETLGLLTPSHRALFQHVLDRYHHLLLQYYIYIGSHHSIDLSTAVHPSISDWSRHETAQAITKYVKFTKGDTGLLTTAAFLERMIAEDALRLVMNPRNGRAEGKLRNSYDRAKQEEEWGGSGWLKKHYFWQ